MKKLGALIAVAVLVLALNPARAVAATLVVNDDAAGNVAEPAPCDVAPDHADIQSAVDAASPGDTILVCPGTYAQDLTIYTNGLQLVGVEKSTTIIEGVDTQPAANFPLADPNIDLQANGVQIRNFTIRSPASSAGAYASGMVIDGTNNVIMRNAFEVSGGDPGSVAIQTWALANGSQGLQDVSGLAIHRNSFESLDANNAFGYEGVFINPQTNPPDPSNAVTIMRNDFSGDMYRAIGIARAYTTPHGNTMTTELDIANVAVFGGYVPLGIKLFDGDGQSVKKNDIGPGEEGEFAAGLTITSSSSGNSVANNKIAADIAVAISSDSNNIDNNHLTAGAENSVAGPVGVQLTDADLNHIVNNKIDCDGGGSTGVSLDATSDNNRVIKNRITSCTTAISDAGTDNVIKEK